MENAKEIVADLSVRARVLEASYALGQAVSRELDMETLCDLVVEHLSRVFHAESLALMFSDDEGAELYVKRLRGQSGEPGDTRLKSSRGAAGTALAEQRLVCLREGHPALRDPTLVEPFHTPASVVAVPLTAPEGTLAHPLPEPLPPPMGSRATAAVPLVAKSKVKGVLALTWAEGEAQPSDEDLYMLEVLAAQAATAIDNAWLYAEIQKLNESLELKVRARTAELDAINAELAATIEELKQTQTQLVQNEKMASLGQLTAGIAHEINNPLAYSISNVGLATARLSTLEEFVNLMLTLDDLREVVSPAERLERSQTFIRGLVGDERFAADVEMFEAELIGLSVKDAADHCAQFLTYVQVCLKRDLQRDEPMAAVRNLLERGYRGLERVKAIVLDLRSFSRLEEAQYQNADVDKGITSTLSIVAHLVKDRQVAIEHNAGLADPYPCFPAKLNQVVLNLLTNAIQASPPGRKVTITTFETTNGPRIVVSDEGCGIPPENLTKIFDPFFTTKPVGHGTGLGLSISYKIIEEHRGKIWAKSSLEEGTTFTIELPPRGAGRRE